MLTDLQSTESPALPLPRTEPIGFLADKVPALAGYSIEKRLGSGGSGEVWKAVAAGGRAKAVKIIFGCLDERRAAQELKSLNRVKSLSHPFLLALESVTVVDGRRGHRHRFGRSEFARPLFGMSGRGTRAAFPRSELMGYLAETAEALDYLESDHGLQHLDVKPENLLARRQSYSGRRLWIAEGHDRWERFADQRLDP